MNACRICGCKLRPTNTSGICCEDRLLIRNGDIDGEVWLPVIGFRGYEIVANSASAPRLLWHDDGVPVSRNRGEAIAVDRGDVVVTSYDHPPCIKGVGYLFRIFDVCVATGHSDAVIADDRGASEPSSPTACSPPLRCE